MSVLDNIADQAIAKLDHDDAGQPDDTNNPAGNGGQDDDRGGEGTPGAAGKQGAEGGGGAAGNQGDADGDGSGKTEGNGNKPAKTEGGDAEEEGEFTADDALEVEDKSQNQQQPTDQAGIALSPQEQKYIADNIGEPIIIRGVQGEGDNAKPVELKVYTPLEIPKDFKFTSDADMMSAQTGFQSLEQKANSLLGNYRQQQSDAAALDFERRENEGIRADLADLQKAGQFPKFTKRPGDEGFDETPQAKQMAEVIAIMQDRNSTYMKQYQQGRPYKHIGFAEAFELWQAKNPQVQAEKKRDDDQKKEDQERKKAAEDGKSNRGSTGMNIRKPTIRSGTTIRDILARVDAEE